jgi:hypothetical protein
MIALTPQSRKRARFDFARNEFSQKSGKTNAPTIGLDGKIPSSTAYQNAPLAVVGEMG